MAAFTCFSELAPELRIMIWDTALHQESQTRVVLLDSQTRRVHPTAYLVSSLLSVSLESRDVALTFYSAKLDVFRMPNLAMTAPGISSQEYANSIMYEQDEYGKRKGCLYINPRQDTFIFAHLNPRNIVNRNPWKNLVKSSRGEIQDSWKVPVNHLTGTLTSGECQQISIVRELQWDEQGTRGSEPQCCWQCEYADVLKEESIRPWYDRDVFPNVSSKGLLIISSVAGEERFLFDCSRMRGEEFLLEWRSRFVSLETVGSEESSSRCCWGLASRTSFVL